MEDNKYKHIKLKGELVNNKKSVAITILSVSHHGTDFGVNSRRFVGKNGWWMENRSNEIPRFGSSGSFIGSSTTKYPVKSTLQVSLETWKKIEETVNEYNEKFGPPKPKPAPKPIPAPKVEEKLLYKAEEVKEKYTPAPPYGEQPKAAPAVAKSEESAPQVIVFTIG